MSVEHTESVDYIGIDRDANSVRLLISDHFDWTDATLHLALIQEKLNTYLRFVESGELFERYPQTQDRRVVFDWVGKYELSPEGEAFLERATKVIAEAGFVLIFRRAASD